jgi:hypothetical protein
MDVYVDVDVDVDQRITAEKGWLKSTGPAENTPRLSRLRHEQLERRSTLDASNSVPRFEPKSEWSALPVQPPAGTWQRRAARGYPALFVNFILFVVLAFTTRDNPANSGWVVFRIVFAALMLQCVFFIFVGIRGAQLQQRERKLGYSTWARKR